MKNNKTFLPKRGRMGVRHEQRDTNAASVVVGLMPSLELRGRVLVVDDDEDTVTNALRDHGLEVITWHRRAIKNHDAQPWIGEGFFDAAFVRYPVSRDAFTMLIHAVTPRLSSGGRLFTYGANDEGIKSSDKTLATLLQDTEVVATKKHCRVLLAKRTRNVVFKGELEDWKEKVAFETPQGNFSLVSYPCLFAHGHLDAGTKLLLQTVPTLSKENAKVLDYGCGIGIIGCAIQKANPSIELDMIDIDAIATSAAKENVSRANVFTTDSMGAVRGRKYDLIVSNPPIHSGKGEDFTILLNFLADAATALARNGELLFVVQATVPVKKELVKLFAHPMPAINNNRYIVWRCSNPL